MRVVGWEFKSAGNLFSKILRAPGYDDASCLAFVAGFISIFLLQVEPLLWRRGIFTIPEIYEGKWPRELQPLSGFWLFPVEHVPSDLSLWLLMSIIGIVNAVLLDRFVAQYGGTDTSFRPAILHLRYLLAGIPVLGLSIIPLWRILWNRKPAWAYRPRDHQLALQDYSFNLSSLSRRRGKAFHSATFILWILISSVLTLRVALAWINEWERATATSLLVVQGICGILRFGGMICLVAYARLRGRYGALSGNRRLGLMVCSGAWLLPKSAFLLSVAAILLIGERWGTMINDVRTYSTLQRDADRTLGSHIFFAIGRPLQSMAMDQVVLKVLRLYREKTFLLMTEVASIMMLVLPARVRYPWMNLPGCLVVALFLAALLSLPLGVVLYARSLLRLLSGPTGQSKSSVESPFGRYLLLTPMAIVGGFSIGVFAGSRDLKGLSLFFFWLGSYGSIIGFAATFWGLLKLNDKSLFVWPLLFLGIAMTGHEMQQGSLDVNFLGIRRHVEDAAHFHLFKLHLMIPLILILTVLVGLYRGRWLLRPFRIKDILSPTLSAQLRTQLAFLILTACLPLGGVLVPFWIRLRVRLTRHPLPSYVVMR